LEILHNEIAKNAAIMKQIVAALSEAPSQTAPNFVTGRQDIIAFLTRKWTKELDYRLIVLIETGNAGRLDKACLGVLSPGGA
jgi:nuclear transport factor 2 (NTF2) superfamily protein